MIFHDVSWFTKKKTKKIQDPDLSRGFPTDFAMVFQWLFRRRVSKWQEGDVAVSGSLPGGLRGCGAVGTMAPWQRFSVNFWKILGKSVDNLRETYGK